MFLNKYTNNILNCRLNTPHTSTSSTLHNLPQFSTNTTFDARSICKSLYIQFNNYIKIFCFKLL